ncbi:serine/threonine-protein kinase [Xanthomonadaceae bacterium JHOS43]|nr:serine/threonine-protein kinase [Xanthomonadaceae bacterium JHOS43]
MTATTRLLGDPGTPCDDERVVLAHLDVLLGTPEAEREAAIRGLGLSSAQQSRLWRLLDRQADAEGFLEAQPASTMPIRSALPGDGDRIGVYRIERPISAGGMGVVYLAWRDDGLYRQRVAIKLVQPSHLLLDPARRQGLLTHFEEERAILAQLQHPNIVRILDGGQTDQGLPYLVMEFVDGVDLMQFCRERKLDVAARLQLFCHVCDAVQEAHRHLIVHRDLKPGNVLVDEHAVPHLLDFGIAKLLDPLRPEDADGQTQATVLGAMTPAYASPEQLRRRPLTTRSDIYSLGVMLYQMLTGKRPYDTDALSPAEIERAVCNTEPPPLSRVLHDEDADPGYAHMPRGLPQDLERIVAKALHKEPGRRYGSAQELADDLRRHIAGLPVLAQPDTWSYRVSKFIGRHRVASLMVGAALSLILTASALALYQAHKARLAAAEAGEINTFLLEVLNQSNIDHMGAEVQLGDVLEAAAKRLDERFGDRPGIAAGIRHAIGSSLLSLNRIDAARTQLQAGYDEARQTLGERHLLSWKLAETLALAWAEQDQPHEAVALLEKVVAQMEESGQDTLPFYVTACSNLGYIHMTRSDYAAAQPHIAKALSAIERHGVAVPDDEYANILGNHAQILHDLDRLDEADSAYRRAAALLQKQYPEGSRDIAILLNNRAVLASDMGRGDEALDLLRESVEMRRRSYRGDHPVVAFGLGNLVFLATTQNRLDLALSAAEEAAAMVMRLYPEAREEKAKALGDLAQVHLRRGEPEPAREALGSANAMLAELSSPSRSIREYLQALAEQLDAMPAP